MKERLHKAFANGVASALLGLVFCTNATAQTNQASASVGPSAPVSLTYQVSPPAGLGNGTNAAPVTGGKTNLAELPMDFQMGLQYELPKVRSRLLGITLRSRPVSERGAVGGMVGVGPKNFLQAINPFAPLSAGDSSKRVRGKWSGLPGGKPPARFSNDPAAHESDGFLLFGH